MKLTPETFVEVVREIHEPYVPVITAVKHGPHDQWHEPSLEDKVNGLVYWCGACQCPASDCRYRDLIDAVEEGNKAQKLQARRIALVSGVVLSLVVAYGRLRR